MIRPGWSGLFGVRERKNEVPMIGAIRAGFLGEVVNQCRKGCRCWNWFCLTPLCSVCSCYHLDGRWDPWGTKMEKTQVLSMRRLRSEFGSPRGAKNDSLHVGFSLPQKGRCSSIRRGESKFQQDHPGAGELGQLISPLRASCVGIWKMGPKTQSWLVMSMKTT